MEDDAVRLPPPSPRASHGLLTSPDSPSMPQQQAALSACLARSLVSVRMTLAPQFWASVRGMTSMATPAQWRVVGVVTGMVDTHLAIGTRHQSRVPRRPQARAGRQPTPSPAYPLSDLASP